MRGRLCKVVSSRCTLCVVMLPLLCGCVDFQMHEFFDLQGALYPHDAKTGAYVSDVNVFQFVSVEAYGYSLMPFGERMYRDVRYRYSGVQQPPLHTLKESFTTFSYNFLVKARYSPIAVRKNVVLYKRGYITTSLGPESLNDFTMQKIADSLMAAILTQESQIDVLMQPMGSSSVAQPDELYVGARELKKYVVKPADFDVVARFARNEYEALLAGNTITDDAVKRRIRTKIAKLDGLLQ